MRADRSLPELHPVAATAAPLGRAVPLLALLGLAVLLFCTLPAISEHRRLLRDHERLTRETQAVEGRLSQLRREVRDAQTLGYLRMRAAKRLAWDGQHYLARRDVELAAAAAAAVARQAAAQQTTSTTR
jgi:hypothetical protein